MVSAIVAIDANLGIGCENKLLISIPEDLKRFKEITTGHTVVMGSNTWRSLPRKPLPNRRNIILSRKKEPYPHDEYLWMTDKEFSYWLEDHPNEEVFIMGGARTYADYIDICDRIYLTYIHKSFKNVDAYFPNFFDYGEWKMIEVSDIKTYENIEYHFVTYERIN